MSSLRNARRINCNFYFVVQEQHESSKLTKASGDGGDLSCIPGNTNGGNNDNSTANDIESAMRQRMHALEELVQSEEAYVQDLSLIVDGYIREIRDPNSDIPMPDDLKGGKERMVFGNIEAIYEWHREYVETFYSVVIVLIQV